MLIRDLHTQTFDDGTIAKTQIFDSYLKEWFPVYITSHEN